MECYLAPGMSGYVGRPPVAITILSAVTCSVCPFASFNSRVFADINEANLL